VADMKVRIGISLGTAGAADEFEAAVGLLEAARVDSLWLPETVYGDAIDPIVGMTFALAKTARLKVGSGVSVLPGRHPVLVAKELASLTALAPGRVLPVFGLQPATVAERVLFPVPAGPDPTRPAPRGAVFDEALTLLRLMLTTEAVTFHGTFFTVDGASVSPRPAKPLDIWLGGSAPAGLRRIGRLADGWLGSFLTPAEAGAAVGAINAAADEAGRAVDQDHFGISLAVAFGGIPDRLAAAVRSRRPDADPATLIADGWAGARNLISAYVDAGLSKFVIRPASTPASLAGFIEEFARELMPLQT
jgi:probable F420-dependent oxidoreductase